jgi:hypothetical protein
MLGEQQPAICRFKLGSFEITSVIHRQAHAKHPQRT